MLLWLPENDRDRVVLAVEHPSERPTAAPALESGPDSFRVALAKKHPQRGQAAFLARQVRQGEEAGINPALIACRKRSPLGGHEPAHQGGEEGEISRGEIETLQRRAAGRTPAL